MASCVQLAIGAAVEKEDWLRWRVGSNICLISSAHFDTCYAALQASARPLPSSPDILAPVVLVPRGDYNPPSRVGLAGAQCADIGAAHVEDIVEHTRRRYSSICSCIYYATSVISLRCYVLTDLFSLSGQTKAKHDNVSSTTDLCFWILSST